MSRDAVLVTGISGNLGRVLARVLHKTDRVIGVDRRPFPGAPKDLEVHNLDIRKRKVEDLFRRGDVQAMIHMAIVHDPRLSQSEHHSFNVLGTKAVLSFAAKYGVRKVVVLSSATVYGPQPGNDNFLTEESPLLGSERFPGIRDLVEVDMYAQQYMWKYPEVDTVILRPAHIVGPTVRNAPSTYLRLPRPWTLAGFDPMVQLIHEEDVAHVLALALRPGVRGVFNVCGPGELPLSAVLRELGRTPIPVPHLIARPLLDKLFQYRLAGFPSAELDHLQFLCTVDGTRAERELAFRPAYTLRETIRSVLGEVPPRIQLVPQGSHGAAGSQGAA
ncbi:MAG: SDR family oxidoreductase [Deltaproteobacteria bacterium]|nr:MAG: SDR family oxidoreductase [Deltaproteobacteria bacterium]